MVGTSEGDGLNKMHTNSLTVDGAYGKAEIMWLPWLPINQTGNFLFLTPACHREERKSNSTSV